MIIFQSNLVLWFSPSHLSSESMFSSNPFLPFCSLFDFNRRSEYTYKQLLIQIRYLIDGIHSYTLIPDILRAMRVFGRETYHVHVGLCSHSFRGTHDSLALSKEAHDLQILASRVWKVLLDLWSGNGTAIGLRSLSFTRSSLRSSR